MVEHGLPLIDGERPWLDVSVHDFGPLGGLTVEDARSSVKQFTVLEIFGLRCPGDPHPDCQPSGTPETIRWAASRCTRGEKLLFAASSAAFPAAHAPARIVEWLQITIDAINQASSGLC
jgi:hypothetical protein